jgi:hypothetical protein
VNRQSGLWKSVWQQATGQGILLVGIWLFVWILHGANDGLWFQGDSPRHAANGLFWKEYLSSSSLPDPKGFTLRYYARYPDICPTSYPPLFYLLEAGMFSAFGASPYVAKVLVMLFSLLAGLYTLAWLRRWLTPAAGWGAGLLLLQPVIVCFSHTIMLNVPALALSLAALYHVHRGLDDSTPDHLSRHWFVAGGLALLAVMTYFQAGVVVLVSVAWLLAAGRFRYFYQWKILVLAGAGLLVLLPWTFVIKSWSPKQPEWLALRQVFRAATWYYYALALPGDIAQPMLLGLAALGTAAGLVSRCWRRETILLLLWAGVYFAVFSPFRAREPRYLMLVCIPLICLGMLALVRAAEWLEKIRPSWRPSVILPLLLVPVLLIQGWSAVNKKIPRLLHYQELAAFVKELAPEEPVLYAGLHDGVFTFYIQIDDPGYKRRVVLAPKVLAGAKCPQDVVDILRTQCGCRWLAVERCPVYVEPVYVEHEERLLRLLHETLNRPEFRLAYSYPIQSHSVDCVDLYEMLIHIEQPADARLHFQPEQVDESVKPIQR